MSDISDPAGASLRLSNDERERAVAALQTHATAGRLDDAELQSRSAAARSAVTRGDLAPLFTDLPGGLHLDPAGGHHPGAAEQPGGAQPAAAFPQTPQDQTSYAQGGQYGQPAQNAPYGYGAPQPEQPGSRWGLLVVSIMPFIAVILFFLTGMVWGYQFSWLWFLLIPLAGALVYGVGGAQRRR
ncbi:DUF1707 domain-containing protein [Leifsonia sp. F6_8S_P_1B]|uniref:DUF1707 domain-containing protein n=1 Tax=Leifsonia williamsii TaxID=3035919 RepID=A0ABT8KD22_9MICO|nr:DUF1707 domain-containing protein [Leifsonia williamsii]MDN4615354.1 DUF1707 domain-containing protein [Leifsonia williamsii]